MIITCPNCATKFEVPQNALGPNGRKLKCAKCGHIWLQEPLLIDPLEGALPLDPVQPVDGPGPVAPEVDPFASPDEGDPFASFGTGGVPSESDFGSFDTPRSAAGALRDPFDDGFGTLAPAMGSSVEKSDSFGQDFDTDPAAGLSLGAPPDIIPNDAFPNTASTSTVLVDPPFPASVHQDDGDDFPNESPFKADAELEEATRPAENLATALSDDDPAPGPPSNSLDDSSLDQVLQTLEAGLDQAAAAPAPLTAPKLDKNGAPAPDLDANGRMPRIAAGPAPVKRLPGRRILEVVSVLLISLSLLATGLLVFRSAIVAQVPQMLNAYSFFKIPVDIGSDLIAFQDVVTVFGEENGRRTSMTIRGVLHNISEDKALPLTDLVLRVYDDQKTVLQEVTIPPPQLSLDPKSRIPFEISMRNPPERAKGYFLGFAGTR